MAVVKKAFSIDDTLAEQLDEFVKSRFGTAREALSFMLAAAQTQVAKTQTNRDAEIANVQSLLTQLSNAFTASWSYNSNAENRIKAEFESKLEKMEANLQANSEVIEKLKSELLVEGKSHADALKSVEAEKEKIRLELVNVQAENEKIKADSSNANKLISALEEAKSKLEMENKSLRESVNEINALRAEIERMKKEKYEFAKQVRKEAFDEFQALLKTQEPVKKTVTRKTATDKADKK